MKFGEGVNDVSHYDPGVVERIIDIANHSEEGKVTLPTIIGNSQSSNATSGQTITKEEEAKAMDRVDHPGGTAGK